jgi:riboflavin synthase
MPAVRVTVGNGLPNDHRDITMFTGIIEGLGTIEQIRPSGEGKRLSLSADFGLDGTKIGDSLAINGACLTAVVVEGSYVEADVSPETLATTTLGTSAAGNRVNIERALRVSDRMDGHLVTGHIDGTGILSRQKTSGNALLLTFTVGASLLRYMVKKGSVAVDGISLTINRCGGGSFEVSLIPHTAKMTTLALRRPGERVNIETDVIGKYVERFVSGNPGNDRRSGNAGIDRAFLNRTGYL